MEKYARPPQSEVDDLKHDLEYFQKESAEVPSPTPPPSGEGEDIT